MSTAPKICLTSEDYLHLERQNEFRSEFVAGEMFAMAGITRNHDTITGNIYAALRPRLRGKSCFLHTSDMKIWIPRFEELTYPDASVTCGERQFGDPTQDVLLNPVLIIEVLSKSIANYDRSEKFAKYREIPSFQEYLLVSQDRVQVEHYVQLGVHQWSYTIYDLCEETISLTTAALTLSLSDVYEDVAF